ncbi:MAG TPA: ClpXP protease specificity-enhancing factor [Gammaproteobacteria bacterium]|nr:ClpXP protease specificity-enhancing factor [Gammaproteobacteria bacterium]
MTSSRPYLLRALYDWIVDNGLTPHILVNAEHEAVQVPAESVQDGRVVLNVGPTAVRELALGNEFVAFNARFGGRPMDVMVPIKAVEAIYARENGKGMVFGEDHDDEDDETPPPSGPEDGGGGGKKPNLQVVK